MRCAETIRTLLDMLGERRADLSTQDDNGDTRALAWLAEAHVADTADEVGELTRAFNEMVTDIRESRDRIDYLQRIGAWQDFARRLAHEIKNPLTPIQLSAERLKRIERERHDVVVARVLLAHAQLTVANRHRRRPRARQVVQ